MNDLALLLHLFRNSEETKLLICTANFVWCLQHQRNRGLNFGQKSANIVTDALILNTYTMLHALQNLWKITKLCENYCQTKWSQAVLSGGSSHLRPYRNTTSMDERVQYPKYACAYDFYRPGEWDGKEWAVQKINRGNESHGQKNQGLNTPEFHSSA